MQSGYPRTIRRVVEVCVTVPERGHPNAYGTGSDDDAIEDMGVGTRDGGLFRG